MGTGEDADRRLREPLLQRLDPPDGRVGASVVDEEQLTRRWQLLGEPGEQWPVLRDPLGLVEHGHHETEGVNQCVRHHRRGAP